MSSTYGENLKLSIFGQSHSPAIGMVLDGIPAGLPADLDLLQKFLNRRAPGQNLYTTSRKETDTPEFLSGLLHGYTCGAPICAVIENQNQHSFDYENLKDSPRPGHADFTAQIKYRGFQDVAGGGHFSGRLTAPLCIAGGLCLQWLAKMGIEIKAKIDSVEQIHDTAFDPVNPELSNICKDFPVLNAEAGFAMQKKIQAARAAGDSVGGTISCAVTGLPAGWGDPMFGGMESRIAQIVYGIPAVKGLEFGSGFAGSETYGSENNDAFIWHNGTVRTVTNHCGGILGGITDGMPLLFRVALKPVPSIAKEQDSVSFRQQQSCKLKVHGRHDPCIVLRAVPVVEAAAALALYDAFLGFHN